MIWLGRTVFSFVGVTICPFAFAQPADFRTVFSSNAEVSAMAVDKAGNIYLAGSTRSIQFPATPGAFQSQFRPLICRGGPVPGMPLYCADGFIAKLDPSGTRVLYSTLIGGLESDVITGLQVQDNGNVWFTGITTSDDFPVSPSAWRRSARRLETNAFVGLLNPTGSQLLYSSYIPGAQGRSVIVAPDGDVLVSGDVLSNRFEISPGSFQTPRYTSGDPLFVGTSDVFALRLSPDLSQLRWASAFGGSQQDSVRSMFLDAAGDVVLVGNTSSTGSRILEPQRFPLTSGALNRSPGNGDMFACKLRGDGKALRFCAAWGGQEYDLLYSAHLEPNGSLLWSGGTRSLDFPVTSGSFQTIPAGAVIGRLSADGSKLDLSTYAGEDSRDWAETVQRSNDGTILVYGKTYSASYPTSPGAERPCFGGVPETEEGLSPFILRLSPDGSAALYSTYAPYRLIPGISDSFYTMVPFTLPSGILQQWKVDQPWPSKVTCLSNAASYRQRGISPGEIVTLFGNDIGPATAAGPLISADGRVSGMVANTRVLIGGTSAPLLYVSQRQINAIVPDEIAALTPGLRDVAIEVERNGRIVDSFRRTVARVAPSIFTVDGSGRGAIAAVNQDGSLNPPARPAPRGSVISMYLTGTGLPLDGARPDGSIALSAGGTPRESLVVRFGTVEGEVLYVGYSPGQVVGLTQVNVQIPRHETVTGRVVINATVGGEVAPNVGELFVWVQ